ncbi:hypothetical protein F503_04826 [Ophiostoma piceae UAMH 11346]|uniref:Uncharacterized protein n=1 Tax=Ophiostoma piceae (strain UAMH 11346) TaxID=1262450 RepID=S3CCD4_OPHP1|nr:hypothetical protein F503_04826 [Ophiostoma piceae UAMH 11346]
MANHRTPSTSNLDLMLYYRSVHLDHHPDFIGAPAHSDLYAYSHIPNIPCTLQEAGNWHTSTTAAAPSLAPWPLTTLARRLAARPRAPHQHLQHLRQHRKKHHKQWLLSEPAWYRPSKNLQGLGSPVPFDHPYFPDATPDLLAESASTQHVHTTLEIPHHVSTPVPAYRFLPESPYYSHLISVISKLASGTSSKRIAARGGKAQGERTASKLEDELRAFEAKLDNLLTSLGMTEADLEDAEDDTKAEEEGEDKTDSRDGKKASK